MISVHYKHHILIKLREAVCKLFDELIHTVDHIHIVFILPFLFFAWSLGYLYFRILNNLLCRVFTVTLYRNSVDIVLAVGNVQSRHYLVCKYAVFSPVLRSFFDIVHILYRCEIVKSEVFEHLISVIENSSVVMYDMGTVAYLFEIIRNALKGLVQKYRLVRIFSRSEELCTHTCN